MLPRDAVPDAEAAALLVLVVRADPVAREQGLRQREPARQAGADGAAEVPRILHAVEGVQQQGEGQGCVRDEVCARVGLDV